MHGRAAVSRSQQNDPAVTIPHDIVNEQVLISAASLDVQARQRLVRRLRPEKFLGDGHDDIWAALSELDRLGLEFSCDTLQQISGGRLNLDYVRSLAQQTLPPNISHHVEMFEWDSARAEAVRGPISAMLDSLRDPTTPPDRVRALARQVAVSFDGFGSRRYLHEPSALVRDQMAEIAKRRTRSCFPYGVDGLDRFEDQTWRTIPGAAPGQVTVVTGVPGSGKSTLVARIALAQALKRRRVLYGAWEMGGGTSLELLAAMRLGMSRTSLSTGQVTDEQLELLRQKMDAIAGWIRFMSLPFGKTPGEKRTNDYALDTIHGYIADTGCDVAVFDLWKRALKYIDPDDEEQALVRQQAIAEECHCHVILVQQQRLKDIEQRQDKRPTREGIKGSGAWVEVADTILGVHRPALWKAIDDNALEVDVLKQRYARWPLAVEFDWDADRGVVANGRSVHYDQPSVASVGAGDRDSLDAFVNGRRKKK